MGIYNINDINHLADIGQKNVMTECREQGIKSSLYAAIRFNDEFFGCVRADSTSTARIWQYKDMDLLITAANAIGMSLHYQNKTLKDL